MTALERLLGLRRGERERTLLLSLYLFLIISTYVAGKATRDALFLGQYDAARLPYADTAIAVGVALLVALYVRARRRMNLLTLQVGSLLFFSSNALLLWWLGRFAPTPAWHPAVVYIWVGILGVLGPVQVWTLANYVLTMREAKRLFGVIGSGAILGWVVGGLMTTAMARRFGAEDVLVAVAAALAGCAALVVRIWRRRPTSLAECAEGASGGGVPAPDSLCESLRLVWRSPYLRAIALVIACSSVVTGIAAWQFKAVAKAHFATTNDLAAFFGWFNVYAGLLALVTQCLVTSRVLRRFGVGVALFVVPVALALGSAGMLVWGTLAAVIVLKGSDHVLRYSIDKATVESLFLPIPPEQTFHAKLVIDGIVWRIGDMASSAVLLAAVAGLGLSAAGVTWINLVLLGGWMAAAWAAYRGYVNNLTETIQQHRLDADRASASRLDPSVGNLTTSKLASATTEDVLSGLALVEASHRRATHPAIRPLLGHPAAEVRARAIANLSEARDASVLPAVRAMLGDTDPRVRTEALLYLTHHEPIDPLAQIQEMADFDDYSIRSALVAFLARPGAAENLDAASLILDAMIRENGTKGTRTRLEAARLLGTLPNHFEPQLRALLADQDVEVARHAIRTVGRLRKRAYIEPVLARLGTPELAPDAADALVACGDRVVGTLRDRLMDPEGPIALRREIPDVLRRIGTAAASDALLENLITADTILRFRIISSLNKLHQAHPDYRLDPEVIDTVLLAEIMGHYRSYETLGPLGLAPGGDDPVTRGLRTSMEHEIERIFRLLQLRLPGHDIYGTFIGVRSSNPAIRDKGLELLDHVLGAELRPLLLPLVDPEVTVQERMDRAVRLVGHGPGNQEEAVSALICSENPCHPARPWIH